MCLESNHQGFPTVGEENEQHTFVHLDVDGSPPNIIFARLLVDNSLVFGATASLLAREIDESTGGGDNRAFVADGVFVEKSYGGVAFDINAIHVEPGFREVLEIFDHNWRMSECEIRKRREEDIQFE
jgi:hypothetical protein